MSNEFDIITKAVPNAGAVSLAVQKAIEEKYGNVCFTAFFATARLFSTKLASSLINELVKSGFPSDKIEHEGPLGIYLEPSKREGMVRILSVMGFKDPAMAGRLSDVVAQRLVEANGMDIAQPTFASHDVEGGSVFSMTCEKDVAEFMGDQKRIHIGIMIYLESLLESEGGVP